MLTDPTTKECEAVQNEAAGALRAAGTKIYTGISGTGAALVYAFLAGRLAEVSDATVPTHAVCRIASRGT